MPLTWFRATARPGDDPVTPCGIGRILRAAALATRDDG